MVQIGTFSILRQTMAMSSKYTNNSELLRASAMIPLKKCKTCACGNSSEILKLMVDKFMSKMRRNSDQHVLNNG